MKVSFDFDETLDSPRIQTCAQHMINKGYEVHIVTARPHESLVAWGAEDWNNDLYLVSDSLGIPRENIYFMNSTPKYKFFINKDFIWHLDDDLDEWKEINTYTKTRCYKLYDEFDEFLIMVNKE